MKCSNCNRKIKDDQEYRSFQIYNVHLKCMDIFIKKHVKKGKAQRRKRTKKQSSKELTQKVFNKYIRLRDTRPDDVGYCISCNRTLLYGASNAHAGHYKTVGARDDLRYNELNCHIQCQNCNNFGTTETGKNYTINIIKKIGQDKVDSLNERINQDYSEANLKEIRKKFSKLIKELQ